MNLCHTTRDGNGSQRGAIPERPLSNARHVIGCFLKHNGLGDNDIALVTSLLDKLRSHCFLIEAVFNAYDNFFFHDYMI
jgi:hypothetical protein